MKLLELLKSINWGTLAALLGLACTVTAFMVDRKRKRLEVEKLRIEIARLRGEALIYRPSQEEIDWILKDIKAISIQKHLFWDVGDPLDEFFISLEYFLTDSLRVDESTNSAYPTGSNQFDHEHPQNRTMKTLPVAAASLYKVWQNVMPMAESKLDAVTILEIDFVLRLLSGPRARLDLK